MEYIKREIARGGVLTKLGLSSLVTTSKVEISAGHHAHVELQTVPARFEIDGLTIDAPAGIYHPTPESSSLLFIRNLRAFDPVKVAKTLEIGTGCGAIALFLAARMGAKVTASDISSEAVASAKRNAALNRVDIELVKSDLFDKIEERDFDLIVFNTPLIDKAPENAIEKYSLCDPDGAILGAYLRQAGGHIKKNGLIIFSLCSNSAYEVMDSAPLRYRVIALELGASGFWRAIIGAEH
jgi:release factor glutamine methyltransferase